MAPGFVEKGQDPDEAIKNEKFGVSDSDAEMGLGSARIEQGSFGNRGTSRPRAAIGTPYCPKTSCTRTACLQMIQMEQ
jgi:hypothetical protein